MPAGHEHSDRVLLMSQTCDMCHSGAVADKHYLCWGNQPLSADRTYYTALFTTIMNYGAFRCQPDLLTPTRYIWDCTQRQACILTPCVAVPSNQPHVIAKRSVQNYYIYTIFFLPVISGKGSVIARSEPTIYLFLLRLSHNM
jgi:hypothetical protein